MADDGNYSQETVDLRVSCGSRELVVGNMGGSWGGENGSQITQIYTDLNISNYSCGVEFDYIVDPIIIITEEQIVDDSLLKNVTDEKGDANFTHLNISLTAPYDSLVGYCNFDRDNVN